MFINIKLNLNFLNYFTALFYRVGQGLVFLFFCRTVTLGYSPEIYGLLSLLISFAAYMLLFDFGVISYLRTEFAFTLAASGEQKAYAIAKKGLSKLFFLIFCSGILLFIAIEFLNIPNLLLCTVLTKSQNINYESLKYGLYIIFVFSIVCALGNFALALCTAKSNQYRYYGLQIVGLILQVISILAMLYIKLPIISILSLFLFAGQLPIFFLILFEVSKTLRNADTDAKTPTFAKTSLLFSIVQVGGLLANNIDILIVAKLFSLNEVAVYSIMKQIISFPIALFSTYLLQVWPEITKYRALNNVFKIKGIVYDTLFKTLLFNLFLGSIICFCSPAALSMLSNGTLKCSFIQSSAFSLLLFIYTTSGCFSCLLFAFNQLKALALVVPFVLPILYGVSLFGKINGYGIESVATANAIIQLFGLCAGLHFFTKISKVKILSLNHKSA